MSEEEPKVVRTRVRKYPDKIEDEDIELCMKEWKLVGCEVYQEGTGIVIYDSDRGTLDVGTSHYLKIDGVWHYVNVSLLRKLESQLRKKHQLEEHAKQAELMTKQYIAGKSAIRGYQDEVANIDSTGIIKKGIK